VTGSAVAELEPLVGLKAACDLVGHPRASLYRARNRKPAGGERRPRPPAKNALSVEERQDVLDVLHSARFVDVAPAQVWAILLDEGCYLCSISTMYRLLRACHGQVTERRRQAKHPARVKPELIATGPNMVWSWDISMVRGPARGCWYHLYVIIDIYSRYVPGWMVAASDTAELAERFIADALARHHITPGTLTVHADRGSSMTSKPVAALLEDLGVARTHSRPHVSNDKASFSYCTSWGGLGVSSFLEAASGSFDERGVAWGGRLEESFVLVVGFAAAEQAGPMPRFDGGSVYAEPRCDLVAGEESLGAEPVAVAGKAVLAA
jgi:putative transposase